MRNIVSFREGQVVPSVFIVTVVELTSHQLLATSQELRDQNSQSAPSLVVEKDSSDMIRLPLTGPLIDPS